MLHDEVGRLPATYRAPIVLCYFEGLTHEEAANRLRWPVGTLSVRLRRARKLLEERLTRRGLALASAAVLLIPISGAKAEATAGGPRLARRGNDPGRKSGAAKLTTGAGATSTAAAVFAEGVLKTMFWNQIRMLAVVLLAVGLTSTGSAVGFHRFNGAPQSRPEESKRGSMATPEHQAGPAPDRQVPPVHALQPADPIPNQHCQGNADTHFRLWSERRDRSGKVLALAEALQ